MFSLTVCFGPTNMVWAFLFKEKESARAGSKNIIGDYLVIEDDFGQKATIKVEEIHGSCLEDMEAVEEARILRSLANARGEVKARHRAQSDPLIQQAQRGPAVLSPMGGRFNG